MSLKIFCDIADLNQIRKFNKKKIVKGFTTNPSLMRKAGAKDYKSYSKQILNVCKKKPVSLEVFADKFNSMVEQGIKINKSTLNNRNIKLNVTSVYTAKQTKKILKCINKRTKVIISIFAGRASDVGKDPIPEFKKSIKLSKKFKNVEILWASVREPYNYLQAKQLKCHIITTPPSIIQKIEKFGKSFDELTTETVKTFLNDSKKSKFKI